ncbi:MAG: metallophosphoesterase [Candidatus Staskawiczbacteria bacterium]|nr:metallophosphoesterase [Candidatus Staskawiczbacteria bacterium]
MKFAIVSDTHDNIKNFNKIIDFLNKEKITTILHCGDICNQELIDEAVKNFKGEIVFVRGNGDYELSKLPEKEELVIGGKKIAFIHYPDLAKEMAESGKYDLVFYGHTHRPWEEKLGQCRLINPGEVAGQRFKPTFALYDTENDKLELKILEKL